MRVRPRRGDQHSPPRRLRDHHSVAVQRPTQRASGAASKKLHETANNIHAVVSGQVREGDTFTVTKLDRLARSVGDLLEIVARLEAKKVSLRVLAMSGAEPLDTGTAIGRLMLAVIGAVGQAEREAMLERQREGIAKAKAQGRYKGRAPTARRKATEIVRLKEAGVMPSEIASRLGIGRASVYWVLGGQAASDQMAHHRLGAQHRQHGRNCNGSP